VARPSVFATEHFASLAHSEILVPNFIIDSFSLKRVLPEWQRVYHGLSLRRRFTFVWLPLLLASMLIFLSWTHSKINLASSARAGETAAVALHGMIVPFAKDFADGTINSGAVEALRSNLGKTSKILGVKNVKVWGLDGRMVFAVNQQTEDQTFPLLGLLSDAVAGRLSAAVHVIEDAGVRSGVFDEVGSRNEIYIPIRWSEHGKVVAVAEFHPETAILRATRSSTFQQIWTVAGMVFLALLSAIYCMMAQADRQINRLHHDLGRHETKIRALQDTSGSQDLEFQDSASMAEFSESLLRRIGADIHDGIGQLLAVAMLRLDGLFVKNQDHGEVRSIRNILEEAMTEIREVCVGLSLPHIDDLPIAEAVRTMVLRHERRTSTEVRLTMENDLTEPSLTVKTAICRLIQEGLNNAFKHAQGQGQSVTVRTAGPVLVVTVSDTGPCLAEPGQSVAPHTSVTGMGLVGLGARVKSVGGAITISGAPEKASGTSIQGEFPVC
jgi:signal transduction histidine kinase